MLFHYHFLLFKLVRDPIRTSMQMTGVYNNDFDYAGPFIELDDHVSSVG